MRKEINRKRIIQTEYTGNVTIEHFIEMLCYCAKHGHNQGFLANLLGISGGAVSSRIKKYRELYPKLPKLGRGGGRKPITRSQIEKLVKKYS